VEWLVDVSTLNVKHQNLKPKLVLTSIIFDRGIRSITDRHEPVTRPSFLRTGCEIHNTHVPWKAYTVSYNFKNFSHDGWLQVRTKLNLPINLKCRSVERDK
jgi:hypothetical protein